MPFSHETLWQVERGGEVKAYVFGTLHIGSPLELGIPADVFQRFGEAQGLVLEVTPEPGSDAAAEILRRLPKGTGLRALLGDQAYAQADALARPLGLPSDVLDRLKPWAALALLQYSSHLPGHAVGGPPDTGRACQAHSGAGTGNNFRAVARDGLHFAHRSCAHHARDIAGARPVQRDQ